jgi:hypothetical protein
LIESRLEDRGSRAGRLDRMGLVERHAGLVRGSHVLGEVLSNDTGLLGGPSAPLLRRIRNTDSSRFHADVDALVGELAVLGATNAREDAGRSRRTRRQHARA